ncbi:putative O-glycosylation ligase, exosortase A system-associated [Kordiimonas aquimaris]|uniref:putative O-glycosylation ligase, exosortase A system-associated n=1 Tax=Kordiimonas aquimaris TaxID=707591 RepID=UPI0021CE10F3|nr:putative O-glycosylation ligase, exosortase A system-associated [Kordiimonas aquimaris]
MKSALVALLIFIWMPIMVFKPQIGVLVWNWVSFMSPQSYTYGFAATFPFLVSVGGLTALGVVISKDEKSLPAHPIIFAILIYFTWTLVTSGAAFEFEVGKPKLIEFSKTIAFTILTAMIMKTPNRLKAYYYVMMASLLFIGIKGGVFTAVTGGGARVQGAGGMMGDNNQLAMAMAMTFPLTVYLAMHPPHKWLKWPMFATVFLVILAVLGTQSRGGFAAIAAVLFMFLLKSKHKFTILIIAVPLAFGAFNFMPDSWKNRMESTEEATDDNSFMGRVSMWKYATNVASDHPIEGGGFDVFYIRYLGPKYMPPGYIQRAPHSSYFEVLGEHGYVGLLLFLTILFTGWYSGATNAKRFRRYEETIWLADMSTMIQLALLGYAMGSLTVNIALFDVFYNLLIVLVLCRSVGDKIIEKGVTEIKPKGILAAALSGGGKDTEAGWKPGARKGKPQPAE